MIFIYGSYLFVEKNWHSYRILTPDKRSSVKSNFPSHFYFSLLKRVLWNFAAPHLVSGISTPRPGHSFSFIDRLCIFVVCSRRETLSKFLLLSLERILHRKLLTYNVVENTRVVLNSKKSGKNEKTMFSCSIFQLSG